MRQRKETGPSDIQGCIFEKVEGNEERGGHCRGGNQSLDGNEQMAAAGRTKFQDKSRNGNQEEFARPSAGRHHQAS